MTAIAEFVAVREAATERAGVVLAPPPVGRLGSRPRLRRITGGRLDEAVATAGPSGDPEPLHRAGALLAALHGRTPPVDRAVVGAGYPWRPLDLPTWLALSPAQRELAGWFTARRDFCQRADQLSGALARGAIWLHGDARADNICPGPAGGPLLIDWECTGTGRAEYDLGALAGSLISIAVTTGPASNGDPAAARGELRRAVGWAAGLVGAVLHGYRTAYPAAELDRRLIAGATGLSLITTCWARCGVLPLDRRNQTLARVGGGLVEDPRRWSVFDDRCD
ncbi:phosphotransferase [Solwaraspora sp. WMMD791]|uniref:phosphotransferase n=1 Tax=Solwaraspora sp. WMMD791 TaxID=3016086 RepID=UPI00249CB94B|nr:phosphotransferase [Solwaraspora sp. WMMD791]WFE28373.1 phosphotransferase [Solwaraspora sp. WMMD791]